MGLQTYYAEPLKNRVGKLMLSIYTALVLYPFSEKYRQTSDV